MLSCLQKIEKTAPEMSRRVKRYCSLIFKYAIVTNRVEPDVTYGLDPALKKFKRGHFASIDVDETSEFLTGLQNHRARLTRPTYLATTYKRKSLYIAFEIRQYSGTKPN